MDTLLIHVLNSLLYAAVLFLIAGGLSLIYGVMRIVNLAHGNLFAFGAFVAAWTVGRLVGGPTPTPLLYLVLLAGPLAAAALGAVLEPTLLRPLYNEGMGSLNIGESIYPAYNLAVIVVGGLAAAGLWAFIYRTQFGVVLRATSQNMRMAQAMGVNVNRVYVQAFTLGCFMAGLGGAIVVPQQGAVLGMGVDALILAFVVVVIGGLGSLEGALIGALLVGVVRELGITLFPEVELAVLYLMATAVLLIRPAGLFGRA